jgi:hypothetical protein
MVKSMRQSGCIVEEFPVAEELIADTFSMQGKRYIRYKLYEGMFYPVQPEPIAIPRIDFQVLTYLVASNGDEGIERKSLVKTFSSPSVSILVKSLPQNKGKEVVPVGYFSLSEYVYPKSFHTGKSFKYIFRIIGEGNIATIPEPIVKKSNYFDIYAPKITKEVYKQDGRITGVKSYEYYITPKEPGEYLLSEYFYWPFFNHGYSRYDTLFSGLAIKVRGESLKNNYISVNNPGDFYSKYETASNEVLSFAKNNRSVFWINLSMVVLFIGVVIISVKR